MANLYSLTINDTGQLTLPTGTTAQRPTVSGTATVTQFTSVGSTTWTCPSGVTQVEVLVVAGGGGGGSQVGGGGGGGGVIYNPAYNVSPGTVYTVTVGDGGLGSTSSSSSGANGGNSVFDTITATGGGGGGSYNANSGTVPGNGGSGGGGGGSGLNSGLPVGGTGTAGQGFNGGRGRQNNWSGGGGGGAGGAGQDAGAVFSTGSLGAAGSATAGTGTLAQETQYLGVGGQGGPGLYFSISGQERAYGGGGGGCSDSSETRLASGGVGGGGWGWSTSYYYTYNTLRSCDGVANTGGGGGGIRDYPSPYVAGKGGSGIVILRYNSDNSQNVIVGGMRINSNNNTFEYLDQGGNIWEQNTLPWLQRTIISVHYAMAGYKDAAVWSNVNKCVAATDTTTNLGDSSLSTGSNYSSGACSKNIAYIFGAAGAHSTTSTNVIGFNMRTETSYAPAGTALSNARLHAATVFKEHYSAFMHNGPYTNTAIEEYNMITETAIGNTGATHTQDYSWGGSFENYGVIYCSDNSTANFHFATKSSSTRTGTHPAAHHQQKSMNTKLGNFYAGAQGSYAGGNTFRKSNAATNTTTTPGLSKPKGNCGEENHTMGQDHMYMLGCYDDTVGQINSSWKWYYSSETGITVGTTTEPKGHNGMSSGVTGWRD